MRVGQRVIVVNEESTFFWRIGIIETPSDSALTTWNVRLLTGGKSLLTFDESELEDHKEHEARCKPCAFTFQNHEIGLVRDNDLKQQIIELMKLRELNGQEVRLLERMLNGDFDDV